MPADGTPLGGPRGPLPAGAGAGVGVVPGRQPRHRGRHHRRRRRHRGRGAQPPLRAPDRGRAAGRIDARARRDRRALEGAVAPGRGGARAVDVPRAVPAVRRGHPLRGHQPRPLPVRRPDLRRPPPSARDQPLRGAGVAGRGRSGRRTRWRPSGSSSRCTCRSSGSPTPCCRPRSSGSRPPRSWPASSSRRASCWRWPTQDASAADVAAALGERLVAAHAGDGHHGREPYG